MCHMADVPGTLPTVGYAGCAGGGLLFILRSLMKSQGRERVRMIQNGTFLRSLRKRPEVDGREKPCPPHGPIQVQAVDEGTYVASCLVCGLAGPQREDGWEAKLAFDEAFGTLPRTRN